MKQLRLVASIVMSTALVCLAAVATATATTLEVKGVEQTGSVTFKTSPAP